MYTEAPDTSLVNRASSRRFLKALLPTKGDLLDVTVSHAESPDLFYVQSVGSCSIMLVGTDVCISNA